MRCELFDVEVERLTWFSTFTQRSLEEAERVEIAPAAELAPEHRELAEIAAASDESERPDVAEVLPVDRFCELLDLVPDDALVAIAAEEELAPVAARLLGGRDHELPRRGRAPPLREAGPLDARARRARASCACRASRRTSRTSSAPRAADTAARSLKDAEPELEKLVRVGLPHVRGLGTPRRGRARPATTWPACTPTSWTASPLPRTPRVTFAHASLREGFLAPGLKLAVLPEHRLLRRRRGRAPARGPGAAIASFTDLRAGSPVVHEDHGIALFTGFETKTVGGVTRDYLELEYRDGDRVFVPSDQLHKISRYVGADAGDPPLSKLGGKQWEQMKLRARRAAEALAGELINLYAERKRRAGHAFPRDSEWQLEFEDRFPYRETPDQLEAIEAVRADMEEARPMDRLICGDVGYGKTEVALRAAFKAVEDGKQVMFLVPTTVLAQQHFGTFAERLRDYPFTIEMVSRFRSPKEVRESLSGVRSEGKRRHPDRHAPAALARRAPEGPRPPDRRRGAALRREAEGAAAPAAAEGGRALAVGHADPAHAPDVARRAARHLGDRDAARGPPAGEDLRRRLRRGPGRRRRSSASWRAKGQAFFLHNRVETIDETAERVRALVPDARVLVAHGQMAEGELEQVMLDFLRGGRRRARVHHDRRVRPRHPEREHADRGARRRARPGPALPDPRARRTLARARLRLPALPLGGRALARRPGSGWQRSPTTPSSGPASRSRCATSRSAARATCSATSSPATWPRWASSSTSGCSTRPCACSQADAAEEAAEPVRMDLPVDAYVPGDYVPYEAAKIEIHRRVAGAREVAAADHAARGARGPLRPDARAAREPDPAPGRAHQARPRRRPLGRLRRRTAVGHADRARLAREPRRCASACRRRSTSPAASTVRVRLPEEPAERFRAVVTAAEAILEVATEPPDD